MKRPRGCSNSTLDRLWSLRIKELAEHRCEVCGTTENLEAHHVQPRKMYSVRWDLDNGVCLCHRCHKLGGFSAHKNPLGFLRYIIAQRGDEWAERLECRTINNTDWRDNIELIKRRLM